MKTEDKNDGRKTEASYPLYDLAEAIKVAEAARDLGGGNAPVVKSLLAQHMKYAETGPSFFQRVAAARAFGIIDGRGSYGLTELGRQYFYPTVENGKQIAAVKMLTFPKAFSILVQKFDGGKLPTNEMIGNIIHTEAGIPVSKKSILAGCFIRSAQFIGVIDTGGFLRCKTFVAAGNRGVDAAGKGSELHPPPPDRSPLGSGNDDAQRAGDRDEAGTHTYVLPLSQDKKRKITVTAPLDVTDKEVKRITRWLEVSLLIEGGDAQ